MKVLSIEKTTGKKMIGGSLPDIDTDFETGRRGDVKDYIETRFGKSQVVSVGTFTTLKLKGALKDLDRQFDNDVYTANVVTSIIDESDKTMLDLFKRSAQEPKLKEYIKRNSDIFYLMPSLLNQPKAKSIHPCAMVIFPKVMKAQEWVPVRKQNGLIVAEWDGEEMELAGFLKLDILGIKQLDKFSETLKLIEANGKTAPDIFDLPHDVEVYRYFSNGWNGDVFQMGTDSLSAYTKYLRPDNEEDLIATVALYRPGPMENNYHNIYVKAKNEGIEHQPLWGTEEIAKDTYNLIIYQEQIMAICQQLGGVTEQEADDVRRAMGKKNLKYLSVWKDRLQIGFLKNGATIEQFEETWNMMVEFAKYSFNRCISGDTKIKFLGLTKSRMHPTIKQMFDIKNDREYARSIDKISLHFKYQREGYPKGFSLDENGTLVKNKIKDIRYEGKKEVYELITSCGKKIKATCNHKFPTNNGEKRLDEIDLDKDLIYVFDGRFDDRWKAQDEDNKAPYVLNSQKGTEGFITKEPRSTNHLKIKYYKENLKKTSCEKCSKKDCRLEVHHIDGNHYTNNEPENLQTLCVSCHKKAHYKMGRTKAGEKGYKTKFSKIVSLIMVGEEDVYDVEMEAPYHTFTTDTGIVTCNSHAAAYAKTGYICQYLKVHFPLEYWTTSLTHASEENGLKFLSEIFDSKGIDVSPPDINGSGIKMTSNNDSNTIFWGIGSIKGIGEATAEQIINVRNKHGNYKSFADFFFKHNFKGSKVKKQTYEALITSGAFDTLYAFKKDVSKRLSLINRFRKFKKVKVSNKKTDIYTIGALEQSWWWSLYQKKLTGLAFLNYNNLAKNEGLETMYVTNTELAQSQHRGLFRGFGGYVVEMKTRSSVKGTFAFLTVESNYKIYKLILWSNEYEQFKESLKGCEKNFILFDAELKYEGKYEKKNTFTLKENSQIIVLK